jgi:hypothetical protein
VAIDDGRDPARQTARSSGRHTRAEEYLIAPGLVRRDDPEGLRARTSAEPREAPAIGVWEAKRQRSLLRPSARTDALPILSEACPMATYIPAWFDRSHLGGRPQGEPERDEHGQKRRDGTDGGPKSIP